MQEDFLKFFCISFVDCDVKSLSGYEIQRSLQSQVGKIERLEIEGKNSITIKVATRELSDKVKTLKTVCSKAVTIKHHPRYNFTQALMRISTFDVDSEEDLKEFLKYIREQDENIYSIERATFLKSRLNPNLQSFILNFTSNNIPDALHVGGPIRL